MTATFATSTAACLAGPGVIIALDLFVVVILRRWDHSMPVEAHREVVQLRQLLLAARIHDATSWGMMPSTRSSSPERLFFRFHHLSFGGTTSKAPPLFTLKPSLE